MTFFRTYRTTILNTLAIIGAVVQGNARVVPPHWVPVAIAVLAVANLWEQQLGNGAQPPAAPPGPVIGGGP